MGRHLCTSMQAMNNLPTLCHDRRLHATQCLQGRTAYNPLHSNRDGAFFRVARTLPLICGFVRQLVEGEEHGTAGKVGRGELWWQYSRENTIWPAVNDRWQLLNSGLDLCGRSLNIGTADASPSLAVSHARKTLIEDRLRGLARMGI